METYDNQEVAESKSPRNNTPIIIGAVVLLLVLMCCCVILIAGLVADPFDWNLFGFLGGGGDAAVASMPEDTDFYIGLDMDQLTPAQLGRLIDPFLAEDQTLDYQEFAEFLQELDFQLESEAGFNLSDDILPWLGPNVGIGLVDYQIGEYGSLDVPQILVVAETSDSQAADDFIEKLLSGLEDSTGYSFRDVEYEGLTIHELDSDYESERFAVARSGDLVYFANSAQAIEEGVEAAKGKSLADNEEYSKLVNKMSADRAITVYASGDFIQASNAGFGNVVPIDPQDIPIIGTSGVAMTLSFIDPGIRFDVLSAVDVDSLGEEEKLALEGSEAKTADMFPEDTVVYFTGQSVGQYWDALVATVPDYEEAMAELQDEIGFDVVNDLIVFLDGETGIGLWPGSGGILADTTGITLAFAALAGTGNEAALNATSGDINSLLEQQFMTVETKSSDGLTIYTFSEEFSGIEGAYGVGDGYFFIASGEDAVQDVFGGESSLANSDRYKAVWSEFPSGTSAILYVDVEGLADSLALAAEMMGGEIDQAASLSGPITSLALGSDFGGDVSRATVIVFLKSE